VAASGAVQTLANDLLDIDIDIGVVLRPGGHVARRLNPRGGDTPDAAGHAVEQSIDRHSMATRAEHQAAELDQQPQEQRCGRDADEDGDDHASD
jgi:hypothetical protein